MPLRRRKLPHVDVFTFEDVLHHGAVFDDCGLDVIHFGDVALDVFDELQTRVIRVHVKRGGDSLHRVERIRKDAVAFGITLDLIEEKCFAFFATMMAKFGDSANLDVPIRAVDPFQFSELLNLVDPTARVSALCRGRSFFADSCLGLHDDLDPLSDNLRFQCSLATQQSFVVARSFPRPFVFGFSLEPPKKSGTKYVNSPLRMLSET